MKSKALSLLALLLAAPLSGYAAVQLVPAGSLISCTLSEPKLSSKTAAIGDPVLCQLAPTERYGRFMLPYDSYLSGRFEEYKDPGHLVGKGWMELRFDRMVIEPNTVIPIDAKVVDVPGYNVDKYGRILGKGHAVRDTVTWMIPILWPIDLINLPRRGPYPTLKGETRLTLKLMDDMGVPGTNQIPLEQEPSGLYKRPSAYDQPDQAPPPPDQIADDTPPPPQPQYQPQYQPQPQPQYQAPVNYYQAPPPVQPIYIQQQPVVVTPPPPVYYVAPRPMIAMAPPVPRSVVVYRNGYAYQLFIP